MDLTRIKIRGKRKRKDTNSLSSSTVTSAATSRSATPSSNPSKKPRKGKKAKMESNPATPTILGVPPEILEMIFLYSMNINFPRCSPVLGQKLSSSSVYLGFCMRAFCNTKDTPEASAFLQTQVLGSRFFTWSFFKNYVQKAYEVSLRRRKRGWRLKLPDPSYLDGLWPYRIVQLQYLGFAEGFYIPEGLLHGPWSEEKANLLFVLVCLHGEIDWENSMAGETAKTGLTEAIAQDNERAVAALSVLLGIAKTIRTDVVRKAVIECGCNLNIVRHLLFNAQILPGGSMDFHDPALWTWADRAEANGNVKGAQLKDMLKRAETFSLNFYERGQTNFTGMVAFPYSGPKFDARTSLDQSGLIRELLAKLYRNHGRRLLQGRRASIERGDEVHDQGYVGEDMGVA